MSFFLKKIASKLLNNLFLILKFFEFFLWNNFLELICLTKQVLSMCLKILIKHLNRRYEDFSFVHLPCGSETYSCKLFFLRKTCFEWHHKQTNTLMPQGIIISRKYEMRCNVCEGEVFEVKSVTFKCLYSAILIKNKTRYFLENIYFSSQNFWRDDV